MQKPALKVSGNVPGLLFKKPVINNKFIRNPFHNVLCNCSMCHNSDQESSVLALNEYGD